LWEWFEDEGPPPRSLEMGRWTEIGWAAFWYHALVGDPGNPAEGHRLRLTADRGPLLFPGWSELPGVARVAGWARRDLGVLRSIAALQQRLSGPPLDREALVTEIFARAASASSSEQLPSLVEDTPWNEEEEDETASPLWSPGPGEPFATRLARASMDAPELFAWIESMRDTIPDHARLVTADHRRSGMPPPGSLWWRTGDDGLAFLIVVERRAYDRELATGRGHDLDIVVRDDAAGKSLGRSQKLGGLLPVSFHAPRHFRGHDLALKSFHDYSPETKLRPGQLWS